MADPELCRVYVNEVSDAIKRLEEMGLKLKNKLFATMPANPNAGGTNGIVSTQKAILERVQRLGSSNTRISSI